ncbi:hypothetical protein CTAM01_12943 [Colletotrichum tamarilloi]|uniref:Uncharacterized protein n=1 Tax=Colletotrichum tamarilloi TaxID=1209934 RepID=A0ABQ9QTQ8_9PEZI|nr:uncharacterized protein CTAM01_12943 [Colletotrichum tamarilloi]KAK1484572.1 hypothetical protein CTAM01_12943 [Colletotrichum tamarilloi]
MSQIGWNMSLFRAWYWLGGWTVVGVPRGIFLERQTNGIRDLVATPANASRFYRCGPVTIAANSAGGDHEEEGREKNCGQ